MRSRNIKPGFFKNEDLAECDPLARVLFAGLWCMADRSGRLEYRPKRIKAELLPYDDCSIESLTKQLLSKNFILIYSVNGDNYLQISNFTKHQNCHVREPESTIPAPCENGAGIVPAHLIPESPILIPESPNPPTPQGGNGYPDWLPVETFHEYQTSRKRKLKPAQHKRFFARLKRLADSSRASPEQILVQSIENGWEGIFELKENGNGSQQGAMRI